MNWDFLEACAGRKKWRSVKKKFHIKKEDYIIILPEKNHDLNKLAYQYLDEFLGRKYAGRAFVIYERHEIVNERRENWILLPFREKAIFTLLKYYRLCQFKKNVIVVSLHMPYCSGNLIGHKNITLEDMVRHAIYA